MNASPASLARSSQRPPQPRRSLGYPARPIVPGYRRQVGSERRLPGAPPSATLELARACAREVAAGERAETSSLLFLGACALAVLAGCAAQFERCLADWASFESFVQAMLG